MSVAARRPFGRVLSAALVAAAIATFSLALPVGTDANDPSGGAVPVFTYHMVDRRIPTDPIGNALTITPEQFEQQLRTLRRLGLRTVTAAQLAGDLHRRAVPNRTVVLTFDDGYADARTFVLPLLLRYHDVATFYVISGTIGTPRHLSWNDIRALSRAGMEIGAHGREHVDLTELDANGQLAQVHACRRALRRWANIDATTYAYPSGRYDETTLEVMRRAGLSAAFTEDYGEVRPLADPYTLPRIRVLRQGALPAFDAIAAAVR